MIYFRYDNLLYDINYNYYMLVFYNSLLCYIIIIAFFFIFRKYLVAVINQQIIYLKKATVSIFVNLQIARY